ncbi:hypothetical protein T05_2291, partial [Trichinella murrelli]
EERARPGKRLVTQCKIDSIWCSVRNVTDPAGVTPSAQMVPHGRGRRLAKKNLHHTVHSPLPDERTSGKLYLSIAGVQNPTTVLTFRPLSRIRQASPNGYPKLAANKAPLDRLLTELEELNIDAVDDNLLGVQLELTETLFRETDALQAEWEQHLEPRERNAAIEDWAKSRRLFWKPGREPKAGCGQTAAQARIGKLPELTLPLFDGEALEFPTFWAQFVASVHANIELDDATKFAYLLSNTTGRALGAIAGIPVTAANYPEAVGILQKRFGRPKIVARAHFLALWKAPECREMTREGIQTLVDEITKQLRCLAAMGKNPHAGELPLSEALMPGLKEKFSRKLQNVWNLKVGSGPESENNLEKFLEFAQLQADSLSPPDVFSLEASRQGKSGEATRKDSKSAKRKGRDRVTSSAAALVISDQRVCPFCEGDHDATCCQRFLDAEYSARMSMSREKGVCYKCLKTGHRARECRTRRPCGVDGCRQPHHQLLHSSATRKSSRPPGADQPHQSLLAARSTPGGVSRPSALAHTGRMETTWWTLGGRVGPERKWRRVEFRLGAVGSSGQTEASTLVQALAIPRVCGKVQSVPVEPSEGAPTEPEMGQWPGAPLLIDVLISIDYYYEFVTGRIRRTTSGTVTVETRLRWLVCGRTDPRHSSKAQVLLTEGGGFDDDILRRFWEIESLGTAPPEDTDGAAEKKKLKEEHGLTVLGRRLGTHEEDRVRYASVMKQYLDEGWAKPAPATSPPRRTWYLPNHAVYQGVGDERKCRVVFDGAAKYTRTTLNSQLEAGPNLQIDLLRAILSFRRLCIGLQADIEKMYLQIRVRPEDRDACRFLWWDDEQKIRRYRLTRVCFGLTCSPFLAMGTVRSHVRRHQASAPRAAEEVLNNMYMDDLATSCDSVAEARSLADQLGSLLASGGFRLYKWASNEPDALRELPVEKTAMGIGSRPWKTLGIYWQRDDDHLAFVVPERSRLAAGDTKRQMLSTASGIFDPIGCLAPFLVQAKILFQSLWETGADWDKPLPEEVNRPWIDWKRELDDLPLVRFPRPLVSVPLDQAKQIEHHAFCDASERAYGAVVYLRVETASGATQFMGALTAARLIHFTQRALQLDVRSLFCWSDSEVTLAWVRSALSRWKPFARNRVEEIQRLVEPACWRLPGEEQPGRLTEPRIVFEGTGKQQPLVAGAKMARRAGGRLALKDDVLHPGRYGDIERLFRITALCLRFARNCGSATGERRRGPLTVQELDAAEQTWVRIAQRQGFRKEIDELRTSGDVAARSHLRPLSPCLDEAGRLRVRGRLETLSDCN